MKDNIKELFGSIAFCALVWLMLWAYCKATPNQLSGEADWNEAAIEAIDDGERGECAAPQTKKQTRAETIAADYANGDLVFAGANMEDFGKKVVVTLTFARN